MSHYQGAATVIVDEVEYEVEADLQADPGSSRVRSMGSVSADKGLGSWRGRLNVPDKGAARSIHQGGVVRIRLPNGLEGNFLASGDDLGAGQVEITGSGPAPF